MSGPNTATPREGIAYYPGCSLHGTSREFDESLRAIAPVLGLHIKEIDDWSCCGASSGHMTDHLLGVALPARNLALAEAEGFDRVVAPCADNSPLLEVTDLVFREHSVAYLAQRAGGVSPGGNSER